MEQVSDRRFSGVANLVAGLIEFACEEVGLGLDEAVCVVTQVAADYARGTYGNDYLPKLAAVVMACADKPMPQRVQ